MPALITLLAGDPAVIVAATDDGVRRVRATVVGARHGALEFTLPDATSVHGTMVGIAAGMASRQVPIRSVSGTTLICECPDDLVVLDPRRTRRVPAELPATWRGRGEDLLVVLHDLSPDGALVSAPTGFEPVPVVAERARLDLPNGHAIEVTALRVVPAASGGVLVGLRFVDLSRSSRGMVFRTIGRLRAGLGGWDTETLPT